MVPLFLFVGLVALQLLPIEWSWMASIAPGNEAVWKEMLGEPALAGAMPSFLPMSLDAHATRVDLAVLLALVTIFYVVLQVYRSLDQVKRLLTAVSVIGLLVAFAAFVQHLTDSSTMLGLWDLPARPKHGGPFVHVGHFSQYLNLSMGCALALMLVRLAERLPGQEWEAKDLAGARGQPLSRLEILLWILLVLGAVMVAMSNSRNGLLSMLVSGVVITVVLSRTHFLKGIAWPLAGMLVLAFAVLLLMGFDPVYERVATLEDPQGQLEGRFALIGDSLGLWKTSPWLGIGQGGFEHVFPAFDHSLRPGTAAHAENQFVELLAETGIAGLLLVLAFVGLLWRAWLRLLRSRPSPRAGLAYGLGFGLLAVALHALTDFGLRTPSVMLLALLSSGLIVSSARPWLVSGLPGRFLSAVMGFGLAGLLAVQILPAWNRVRAEQLWNEVEVQRLELRAPRLIGTEQQLDDFVAKVDEAARLDSDHVVYRYWSIVHGWQRAVARVKHGLRLAPETSVPKTPELKDAALSARQRLLALRVLMPIYGPLWSTFGQLGVEWEGDEDAARWIWRGQELAPHDPAACLAAGRQALRDKDLTKAVRSLRRAVAMGVDWRSLLMVLLQVQEIDDGPELARQVVSGNAHKLQWLATRKAWTERASESAQAALHAELRRLLEQSLESGEAMSWTWRALAQEEIRAGEDEEALPHLRQYLRTEPDSRMRIELAQLLHRMGDNDAAKGEVRTWLRRHPGDRAAEKLLIQLSR